MMPDWIHDAYEGGEVEEAVSAAIEIGHIRPAELRSFADVERVVLSRFPEETMTWRGQAEDALARRCPSLLTEPERERPPIGVTRSNPLYGSF